MALLTGRGAGPFNSAPSEPVAGVAIRGTAFGGQQPVVGASVQLYAANLSGYGMPVSPLLPANTITSDAGVRRERRVRAPATL